MLKDLNELAITLREHYLNTFVNGDFRLDRDFKERFAQVLEARNYSIQYFDYSAEITSSSGNKIFCPNQWFYLATFIVEFCSELINYKQIVDTLADSNVNRMTKKQFNEKVKNLKGKNIDEFAPEIKEAIINYFNEDETSAEYLCKFLTDYSWWFGSKTIDRHQDYYNSPILSLLGLVAVSQSYIADIVYYMASDPQLLEYSRNLQMESFRNSTDSLAENLIVYGAPGTGKSRYLEENFNHTTRVVFHSDYSYYDFVGNYKPVPLYKETDVTIHSINGDSFHRGEPTIDYQYVPGPFINVLIESVRTQDTQHTLLIEEINRANASAVFGDMFQLLDRTSDGSSQYRIHPNQDLHNYLMSLPDVRHFFDEGLYIPSNMNIVATMNSADQGVYVLDSAFKRRWKFKYIPIRENGFVHENSPIAYAGEAYPWRLILTSINNKLKNLDINEDRLIGPYFISPEEVNDSNNISSKLLIYLWDDVLRYKREVFFDTTIKTYSDLVVGFNTGADVLNIRADIIQLQEEEQRQQEQAIEENPPEETLNE